VQLRVDPRPEQVPIRRPLRFDSSRPSVPGSALRPPDAPQRHERRRELHRQHDDESESEGAERHAARL